jgi:hypothetical protein
MTSDITFGFSSYSFHSKLASGEMTLPQVIDWVAQSEGEHLELASLGDDPDAPIPNIASPERYVDEIREHAAAAGATGDQLSDQSCKTPQHRHRNP